MKNIVLLSDGTGNSAAKRHKTNVWHFYQALDMHCDDQIAFYNDGVGSRGVLPVKLLGGAFGYGLRNNVLELYKTLCRTYEKGSGDKIYLFGFSRGAFTVRMLAGMIARCGLYTGYTDEDELRKAAEDNFTIYREKYFAIDREKYRRGWLTRCLRRLPHRRRLLKSDDRPDIEFIGLWDTVEAYGFPVREIAWFWDRFVFPLEFVDQFPSDKVKRTCHALSIDDERLSFHPVLWDEEKNNSVQSCEIEQVWFAGSHCDVGGGYPQNNLAMVTLDWMISKVEAEQAQFGLQFISNIRQECNLRSDWHGIKHESRSGLRIYYRYRPRDIENLCKEASITTAKIHRGVLERIKRNIVPYAPTHVPQNYEVVDVIATGSVDAADIESGGRSLDYEKSCQATKRWKAMESAHRVVNKRIRLYFVFLVFTIGVIVSSVVYFTCFAHSVSISWKWWVLSAAVLPVVLFGLFRIKRRWLRLTEKLAMLAWSDLRKRNGLDN